MKTVALVGLSKISAPPGEFAPGVEVWTCNQGHLRYKFHRIFDMHPLELILDPHFVTENDQEPHHAFLWQPHEQPIYMLQHYDEIPASVPYPIGEIELLTCGGWLKFTSSFTYMIAMAIKESFERIEIYGFDMVSGEEWFYQREEGLKWISYAKGLGIDVYITPESGLNSKVTLRYGYEGIPMVTKQTIGVHREQYKREQEQATAQMNVWLGVLAERKKQGASTRQQQEAVQMVEGFKRQAAMNEGAMKSLQFLLDTCDLIEPETVKLT